MSSSSESKSSGEPVGRTGLAGGRRSWTPGGARLRALRERAGRTQLWVELEGDLGAGYLQRVESGRVSQPERVTVERVLDALQAPYADRREILQLFGYAVAGRLPTDAEVAWACEASRRELGAVEFPAYVLDCAHRLIAWNRYFPRLLGVAADAPLLARLARRSLLAPWFDPTSPIGQLVADPEAFLPALIRAMRYEMRPFAAEPWYAEVLAELMARPRFRRYSELVEREAAPAGAARALVPVRLVVPEAGMLQFRLAAEPFTRDARFRIVYHFPADPATIRQCAAWGDTAEVAGAGRPSPERHLTRS
jgi:transcriptional regulator with XRE-family HTH domain